MIFMCPYCKKTYRNYTDAEHCESDCKTKIEAAKKKEREEEDYWEQIGKDLEKINNRIEDGNLKYGRHYSTYTYPVLLNFPFGLFS